MNERESREPEPVSPVRDESALGPGEDLDRKPGGFPHAVIAATAGFAIVISVAAEMRAGGAYAHSVIALDEIAEAKTATKRTS